MNARAAAVRRAALLGPLSLVCLVGGTVRAAPRDPGWQATLDLASGLNGGTVKVALSQTTSFALFGGLLRLGAGPRLVGVFGGDGLTYTTADGDLIAAGKVESIAVSRARTWGLNLAVSARLRPWAGLELGADIDVVGVGFGSGRRGRSLSATAPGDVDVTVPALDLLALGRNDRGTLDSEFFAGWWFDDHWAVRAGTSHVVTELVTSRPLDDGNRRFRRSTTLVFAAVSYAF